MVRLRGTGFPAAQGEKGEVFLGVCVPLPGLVLSNRGFRVSDLFLRLPSLPHELEVSPFTGCLLVRPRHGQAGFYQQRTGFHAPRGGRHLPPSLGLFPAGRPCARLSCADKRLQYPVWVLPGDKSLLSISGMKILQLGNERSLNRSAPQERANNIPGKQSLSFTFCYL